MSDHEKQARPVYYKPRKPQYKRRARHHDYTRPSCYMITLKKAPDIPALSVVTGNPKITDPTQPDAPKAIPTRAGLCFEDALEKWCMKYPQIIVPAYVVMPDHIHLCVDVRTELPSGLSRAIASLMGLTTSAYKPGVKFFDKGYTDSIAYTPQQFKTQQDYVLHNPLRLLIKRLHPDLFFKRWEICVDNVRLNAMGNIFLLKNPHIQVVRFSRKFTKEQVAANRRGWEICVENGGVLISPFIHPLENDMRKEAMTHGGRIIRICDNGFSERFAPSAGEFEMLSAGRLLLISPNDYDTQRAQMKYTRAQHLNTLAELLASPATTTTFRPIKASCSERSEK